MPRSSSSRTIAPESNIDTNVRFALSDEFLASVHFELGINLAFTQGIARRPSRVIPSGLHVPDVSLTRQVLDGRLPPSVVAADLGLDEAGLSIIVYGASRKGIESILNDIVTSQAVQGIHVPTRVLLLIDGSVLPKVSAEQWLCFNAPDWFRDKDDPIHTHIQQVMKVEPEMVTQVSFPNGGNRNKKRHFVLFELGRSGDRVVPAQETVWRWSGACAAVPSAAAFALVRVDVSVPADGSSHLIQDYFEGLGLTARWGECVFAGRQAMRVVLAKDVFDTCADELRRLVRQVGGWFGYPDAIALPNAVKLDVQRAGVCAHVIQLMPPMLSIVAVDFNAVIITPFPGDRPREAIGALGAMLAGSGGIWVSDSSGRSPALRDDPMVLRMSGVPTWVSSSMLFEWWTALRETLDSKLGTPTGFKRELNSTGLETDSVVIQFGSSSSMEYASGYRRLGFDFDGEELLFSLFKVPLMKTHFAKDKPYDLKKFRVFKTATTPHASDPSAWVKLMREHKGAAVASGNGASTLVFQEHSGPAWIRGQLMESQGWKAVLPLFHGAKHRIEEHCSSRFNTIIVDYFPNGDAKHALIRHDRTKGIEDESAHRAWLSFGGLRAVQLGDGLNAVGMLPGTVVCGTAKDFGDITYSVSAARSNAKEKYFVLITFLQIDVDRSAALPPPFAKALPKLPDVLSPDVRDDLDSARGSNGRGKDRAAQPADGSAPRVSFAPDLPPPDLSAQAASSALADHAPQDADFVDAHENDHGASADPGPEPGGGQRVRPRVKNRAGRGAAAQIHAHIQQNPDGKDEPAHPGRKRNGTNRSHDVTPEKPPAKRQPPDGPDGDGVS